MNPPGAPVVAGPPDHAGGSDERPADLRLVPGLAAGWAAAAWGTAAGARASVFAALVLGVFALAALGLRSPAGGGHWRPSVLITVAVSGLVLASTAAGTLVRSRPPLSGWIAERAVVVASGRIVADARRVALDPSAPRHLPGTDRFTVRVRLDRVTGRGHTVQASAPVLVVAGPDWRDLTAGRRVSLTARLEATSPGDDVVAVARAIGPPRDVTPGGPLWRVADRLRAGLREACAGLPPDSGGLLPSLVVGDTSRLPDGLRADLQAAGLTHLTAVSGANVAIVAGAVLWVLTGMGVRRSVRVGLALTAVAGFVVVARPQPSVLRAAVMGGVALVAVGLSRRPRGVPVLAAAGLGLLVVDPWLSRSAGFALSCLATAALLLLAPAWTRRLSRWLPVPAAAAVAVPAAAQAACGPVVVLLSPSVSLVAVPANLVAGPAVAPATVLGVLAAAVAPLSPSAAQAFARVGSLSTGWIAHVAHVSAGLPFAGLPWPAGWTGALLLASLTAAAVAASLAGPTASGAGARRRQPRAGSSLLARLARRPRADRPAAHRRDPEITLYGRRLIALTAALVATAVVGWLIGPRLPGPWPGGAWPPAAWAMVQCDVGQGAATVIRSGPDHGVLLDAGPVPDKVDRCLRRLGVRHLDLIVLTHHHADHVLGLSGALHRRGTDRVLVSPLPEPRDQAAAVRRAAARAGVPVAEGWAGATGAVGAGEWQLRWRLLAPADVPRALSRNDEGEGTEVNESSLVTAAEVTGPGGRRLSMIGFGDLETGGQERLLGRLLAGQHGGARPVDVLVVAHHGSAKQVPGLCRALAPRAAAIGVGSGNDYGHPAPSALRMLRDCGARVYRTDVSGDLAFVPHPDGGLAVVTERDPPPSATLIRDRSPPLALPSPAVPRPHRLGVRVRRPDHAACPGRCDGDRGHPRLPPGTVVLRPPPRDPAPAEPVRPRGPAEPGRPHRGRGDRCRPRRPADGAHVPRVPLALDRTPIGMVGLANRPTPYGDEHERLGHDLRLAHPVPVPPDRRQGVGESATVGSPAAYVNAVVDALSGRASGRSTCRSSAPGVDGAARRITPSRRS